MKKQLKLRAVRQARLMQTTKLLTEERRFPAAPTLDELIRVRDAYMLRVPGGARSTQQTRARTDKAPMVGHS